MSVQAGIWNLDGAPVNRKLLDMMSMSLHKFGPDGEATFCDEQVGLLFRPFHTTAESRLEHQPHISAAGRVIMWDGRVDNRDDLVPQLSFAENDGQTDVAIVAAAFDLWGTDSFAKLIGDWAVSVWDPFQRELILARDYIGIKHLFYYSRPNRILWCSHLAPIALCGDRFSLCDEYIASYLASYPDAHLTPYAEISAVPPGRFVRVRDRQIATHSYWAFNTSLKTRYRSDADYEEHYRHLFRQAVRRRLRTDSPVLAELSGGLDSSSIVCIADDVLARDRAEIPSLDTFSYYDPSEPEDDDLPHFMKIEEKRRKTGFHANLRGSEVSLDLDSPEFIAIPGFKSRTEVRAALSEILQAREYRVILTGSGGDEMNGQALNPRIQMADLFVELRLAELAKQLTAWSLLIRKRPWIHLFFQTVRELMPASIQAKFTEQGKVEPWVNRTFAKKYRMSVRQIAAVEELGFARPSARDAAQTIATLSRVMSCSAPSVIERRHPYLDQNLVEFLTTIPPDQLLRPGQRRSLMRRALADLLPPEVLARKTKASTSRCFSVALEKQWAKVERAFSSPLSSRLGYIQRTEIRTALLALKNGQVCAHALGLLNALSLELWLRNIEARGVISLQPPLKSIVDANPDDQQASAAALNEWG